MTILEPSTSAIVHNNTWWYLRKGERILRFPRNLFIYSGCPKSEWRLLGRVICVKGTKMKPGGHEEICLTHIPPSLFSMNLWIFELCLTCISSSPWQLDHLHCFTLKGAALFCQPASFIYYWVWLIATNLARTLHLYKEDWMKSSIYNPSLYKPCLSLCFPEHNLGWYQILCPRLQLFSLLKNHFIP